MTRHPRNRSFVRRERSTERLALLIAGLTVLTACAGRPAGTLDPADVGPDPQMASAPGGAWRPSTGAGTSLERAPGAGRAVHFPGGSSAGQGADTEGAIESIPVARDADVDKSYLIPALEILGFQFLLNQYDRRFIDHDVYGSDGTSIRRNLHRGWVVDKDPFTMNQFAHPYTGSLYHGFARSAGLDYWEALGYDFVGSAVWEVAGETDPPSLNDQITTSFAGSFLGEALYRTANLLLERGGAKPGAFRSVVAGLLAPSAAVNRYAFGERFDGVYPSHDPAVSYWLGVGARRNTTLDDPGALTDIDKDHAVAAFSLDYGLPGKPGYTYERPFDYFHFEATATTSNDAIPENIMVRGLLYGTDYRSGPDYDGIWGLYGSYDYFSPEIFKVSSTGLSLGTTGQYLMSDEFALQGTIMAGGGFTATGTRAVADDVHEYRYGASPQALLAMRLFYGDIATLGFTVNDYLISGDSGSGDPSGTENIVRAQVSLTVRVYEQHAIGLSYVQSSRDPHSSGFSNSRQSVGALSLFYTLLGDEEFGVVRR